MNLIKKLGIIAIGAILMAGCTPKSATTQSGTESLTTESSKTESVTADTNKDMKKIGVIQLVEHKSLDIIYNSFKDELKELGKDYLSECTGRYVKYYKYCSGI